MDNWISQIIPYFSILYELSTCEKPVDYFLLKLDIFGENSKSVKRTELPTFYPKVIKMILRTYSHSYQHTYTHV